MGRLKMNPMMMPCSHHFILKTLIPMAKPIRVRLRMVEMTKYQGVGPPEEARAQQTIPDITPKNVAIRILRLLHMFPPRVLIIGDKVNLSSNFVVILLDSAQISCKLDSKI